MDLREIPQPSYISGEQVISDLDFYRCVVVRRNVIDEEIHTVIDGISSKCCGGKGNYLELMFVPWNCLSLCGLCHVYGPKIPTSLL